MEAAGPILAIYEEVGAFDGHFDGHFDAEARAGVDHQRIKKLDRVMARPVRASEPTLGGEDVFWCPAELIISSIGGHVPPAGDRGWGGAAHVM